MFDIGPSELLVVFVVALLVIGPERLPSAVKTTSLWIGRFRRSFHKIKAEVERELNADEIRRQLHNESILAEVEDAKKQARELASDVRKVAKDVENTAGNPASDAEPTGGAGQSPTTPAADTGASGIADSVKKEINQAVSYVNDISREVKAGTQELEDEVRKLDAAAKSSTDDKS